MKLKGAIFSQSQSESTDVLAECFTRRNIAVKCFYLDQDYILAGLPIIVRANSGEQFHFSEFSFSYGRTWGETNARLKLHKWVAAFQTEGVTSLDPLNGILANDKKERMMPLFAEAGIPIPKTLVFTTGTHVTQVLNSISEQFACHVVIKADGSGGKNISFVHTSDKESVASTVRKYSVDELLSQALLCQQYIKSKNANGLSFHYRAILVFGNLSVLMRFTSASEAELASNMALGGSAELLPANFLSKEEVVILRNAAAATSINIAGIDFLKVGGELFVLEVNNSPGLYTACKLGTEKHLSDIVTAVETLHLQK